MTTVPTATEALRARLVDQLVADGVLRDPAWRAAFAATPREVFVPYFFLPCRGRPGWRLVESDEEWWRGVYLDDALVTQMNGDDAAVEHARSGATVEGSPTSSSSAPSLMAAMLHDLDIGEGMNVLEIGTGSGYNAALLAHRLGVRQVTSIEVDPALARRARAALAVAGHAPSVVTGDGALGHPPHASYDRILVTVALDRIPPGWLTQTRPDALILAPLSFAGSGGLMALLRRDPSGAASGRFLDRYGGFMAVRAASRPDLPTIHPDLLAHARATAVPPAALTDAHPAAFYLSLRCPHPYRTIGFTPADHSTGPQTWGRGADGSTFALVTGADGGATVATAGPLWNHLEAAHTEWITLGRPARDRFGLTADPARQWVWLDDPHQTITEIA